jgi:hypothetical protein
MAITALVILLAQAEQAIPGIMSLIVIGKKE